MTILRKLSLALAATGIAAALLLTFSVSEMVHLNDTFNHTVTVTARKLQLSAEINTHQTEMYLFQRGLLVASLVHDSSRSSRLKGDFENSSRQLRQKFDELRTLEDRADTRNLLNGIENSYSNWLGYFPEVLARCEAGKPEDAQQYSYEHVAPIQTELSRTLNTITTGYRTVLEEDKAAASQTSSHALWKLIGSAIFLVLAGAGMWFVVFDVNRRLMRSINDLDGAARQVAGAAGQVTASSQGLAQAASRQAASLQETSASSREINAVAMQNADNSGSAAQLTTRSQSQFVEVNRALTQMVEAMNGIGASSDKISRIIRVIDEIAFQTNILALNAAVEAARAGEAGLGFSVVADEVRNLAQRCAQAARDTSALIEESISTSTEGRVRVDQVTSAIAVVNTQIAEVRSLVESVSAGSVQQASGISSISGAISEMERITQESASTAEESAAAAEELNAQSRSLRDIVGRFAAMVGA